MKLNVKRVDLEKELLKSIYDLSTAQNNKNKVFDNLMAKGYSGGDIQKILNNNTPLEFLDLIDLGVLADSIYKVTNQEKINPEQYYTDSELKLIAEYKHEEQDDDIKNLLTFDNLIQQSDNQWVGIISVQKFVQLLHSRKLNYNYQTQRNAKFEKHRDTIIQRPNINPDSVKEISEEMIKGTYIYDTIAINILNNGEEDFVYNEKTKSLKFKAGSLDLIDGMHRGKASETALLVNPDIKGSFILMITNFDVDKANYFILQADKRNPLDEEHKISVNVANESNAIVKNINESMKSDMQGLITTDEIFLQEGLALTMFSIMSKTIERLWSPKTRKEVKDISDYLIKFFNELIGLYPEELKFNIKKYKDINLINHQNMFVFYLTVAKELEGKREWEHELNDIMKKTNFDLNNENWISIKHLSVSNIKKLTQTINDCKKMMRR